MRILFMGSAAMACPSLDMLLSNRGQDIVGVVTQPDRPRGRGKQVAPCPVREHLRESGIPVITAVNVNAADTIEELRSLDPDLAIVVAYGQILRKRLLDIPPLGVVNMHASLLPKYRGAAPVQWPIANGDTVTGVTTMYINEEMDAGDIIMQREIPITDTDTGGSLHDKLAATGAGLLQETVSAIEKGNVPRAPQDESLATYAPKLSTSDGRIDWNIPASDIHNRIRAFNPRPGCHCELPRGSGRFLRVARSSVIETGEGLPGRVLSWDDGPLVMTARHALRLDEVQPPGGKPMSGPAYSRGHPPTGTVG